MKQTWTWAVNQSNIRQESHEQTQQVAKAAGLAGIEGAWRFCEGMNEAELEALKGSYEAAGLGFTSFHLPFSGQHDIASLYEGQRRWAVQEAKTWIEKSAILGARVGIQHPCTSPWGQNTEDMDHLIGQLARSLEDLLPVAEALDYTIAVENMLPSEGRRLGSQPEHFAWLVKRLDHPNLGFCLDTGHALCGTGLGRVDEFFDAMGARLKAFHLADNAGDRDSHLAPGHGLVEWDTVFRRAAELGFAGTMCIETPPFAPKPYSTEAWAQMIKDTEALVQHSLGAD